MAELKKLKRKEPWEGFEEHGVVFTRKGSTQLQGVCPFCDKEKFFVHPLELAWDCKTCIISGGLSTFLEKRMPYYQEHLKGEAALSLTRDRNIKPQTLKSWGVGFNPVSGTYMIPMNGNHDRKIRDVHRYQLGKKAYATTSGKPQIVSPVNLYNSQRVWLCEGEWDAMAWYEVLQALGIREDVFASPGAGNFPQQQAAFLEGKHVTILFDYDAPGRKGATRTGNILSGIAKKVDYLHWPSDKDFHDGYDIRDLWTGIHKKERCDEKIPACPVFGVHRNAKATFEFVTSHVKAESFEEEIKGKTPGKEVKKGTGIGLHHLDVQERYRQWLTLNNPEVLEVVYGAAFANRIDVDPLWLFLVAAPGGSKTEILMSLSAADKMVTTTSLTPPALISGHNSGAGDPSLIPKLNGKTLVIKDFTTILNMNITARDEIFGILRDSYDGKTEKLFGNGVHRKYESKFGILAGVTPAIEGYAAMSGVLGERFIKYKIKQPGRIHVGEDVIMRAIMNICKENKMREELQSIGNEVLSREIKLPDDVPTFDTMAAEKIRSLAMWVASLRGVVSREKYTQQVTFKPIAEIGTRLAKQFMGLALGIAIYRQEKTVSDAVIKTICQVAKDTAPDRVEEVVKQLYLNRITSTGDIGYYQVLQIAEWAAFPQQTIRYMLEDLYMLHIVKKQILEKGKQGWRLSDQVIKLIQDTGMYHAEETRPIKVLHKKQ
jgi:hypothetical protein